MLKLLFNLLWQVLNKTVWSQAAEDECYHLQSRKKKKKDLSFPKKRCFFPAIRRGCQPMHTQTVRVHSLGLVAVPTEWSLDISNLPNDKVTIVPYGFCPQQVLYAEEDDNLRFSQRGCIRKTVMMTKQKCRIFWMTSYAFLNDTQQVHIHVLSKTAKTSLQ